MCHVPCESQKPEKNVYIVIKAPPPQNDDVVILWSKNGVFSPFWGEEIFFSSGFYVSDGT